MNLTGRGFALVALLTALAIVATWLPGDGAAIAWRVLALAGLAILARDAWLARGRRLAATADGPLALPLGRSQSLAVTLAATDGRAARLELRPELPAGVVADESVRALALAPGRAETVRWSVRAARLGEHHWAALPVRVHGPLGLVSSTRALPLGARLRALPDAALRPPRLAATRATGERVRPVTGAGSEVLQLRPYRPGDARRAIDWKATARAGRMIARDYTAEQHREVVVAIDAGRTSAVELDGLARLGHFANLAAQVVAMAARDDDLVGLVAFAAAPVAVQVAAPRLHAALAALAPQPEESSPLAAMLRVSAMLRHRALVLVMTDLDDEAASAQLAEAARLLLGRHLVVALDLASPEIAALAARPARSWLDPYVALAAQEHRAGVRAGCVRLRGLGCRTLLAPPAAAGAELARAWEELRLQRRV